MVIGLPLGRAYLEGVLVAFLLVGFVEASPFGLLSFFSHLWWTV